MTQTPHAVIIGAGLGGLAAALRLRARGYRVTILEAREQAGGRASVLEQDGFRFDMGPALITAPWLLEELFATLGRHPGDYFDLMPLDPFYRVIFHDRSEFDLTGDEARLLVQIEAFNRRDVDGYRRLADHARQIFEVAYGRMGHRPFDRMRTMLRQAPAMARLGTWRSIHSLVSKYIQDERLRRAFSFQPLLVGGSPFRTSALYLLIHWMERNWGVHYARGGTGAIVKGMTQLFEEVGGRLQLGCPVDHIETRRGRTVAVHTESGQRIPCDLVVANADPSMVYTHLIDARQRRRHTNRAVQGRRQSMSVFVVYFGARRTWPDTAHHTVLLGQRYREYFADIFERRVLPKDFSIYLHTPTRSDPSVAPDGHEACYALVPAPNLRGHVDWDQEHEPLRDRILDALDATCLPGLRDNLVTSASIDPRHFASELRSYDGAAFGPEPLLNQSAWFRYHNRSEDIDNLFFVGAGTHPGAGVPGVLTSAKVLEMIIPDVSPGLRQPLPTLSRRRARSVSAPGTFATTSQRRR